MPDEHFSKTPDSRFPKTIPFHQRAVRHLVRSQSILGVKNLPERMRRNRMRAKDGAILRPRRLDTRSGWHLHACGVRPACASTAPRRSEEHTSELQSRENLVCRLLLE